ncbi:MAG: hypothetical protein IJ833_08305 [Lachnospiraceae bacterium]|nr:hypothetical protein [Lachnospiraceae bacterium]
MLKELFSTNGYNERKYVAVELPPEKDALYEKEAREYLVLTGVGSAGAGAPPGQAWTASMGTLAILDVVTGELDTTEGHLSWIITDREKDKRLYFNRFKKGTVYKILGRRYMVDNYSDSRTPSNNACYVVKVLESDVKNETMEAILRRVR